jgi:hypothetical protein
MPLIQLRGRRGPDALGSWLVASVLAGCAVAVRPPPSATPDARHEANVGDVADGATPSTDTSAPITDSVATAADTADTPSDGDGEIEGADGAATDVGDVPTPTVDGGQASDSEAVADTGEDALQPAEPDELVVTVSSSIALPAQAQLLVQAIPLGQVVGGKPAADPSKAGVSLYVGPIPSLPMTTLAALPAGAWVAVAFVMTPQGLAAGAMHCLGSAPAPLVAGGKVLPAVTLTLQPQQGQPDAAALCGTKPVATAFLPQPLVATPPTPWGGAHHIQGASDGDRYWVAGSQDGLVSFDLADGPMGGTLANWKVHGGAMCNRLLHHGGHIYCSSRGGYLQVFALDPTLGQQQAVKLPLGNVQTEGMAVVDDALWVAVHGQGLVRRQAKAPFSALPVASSGVVDAWDVAALANDVIAVADGSHGVRFLSATAQPAQLAHLPLAGTSAFLHLHQNHLFVSALGGGLHAIDVSQPQAPKLLASALLPEPVYAAQVLSGEAGAQVLVATGLHVLALPWPQSGAPWQPWQGLDSLGYAMDIDPGPPGWLRISEFLGVRQVAFNPGAPQPQGVLVTRPTLASRVVAAQQQVVADLRLHNVGGQPLQIGPIVIDEQAPAKAQVVPVDAPPSGTWQIAPGQAMTLPIQFTKTVKGNTEHRLLVYHNGAGVSPRTVRWVETTWLQPGDTLPPLVYQDAAGKAWDIHKHLAGKPGVVMVAAQSCPAAVLALASFARDFELPLSKQQITAVAINPWDLPATQPEVGAVKLPFPIVYTPLTTSDGHAKSAILDTLLNQPGITGPPMPLVYVVHPNGKIVAAHWGYLAADIEAALSAMATP